MKHTFAKNFLANKRPWMLFVISSWKNWNTKVQLISGYLSDLLCSEYTNNGQKFHSYSYIWHNANTARASPVERWKQHFTNMYLTGAALTDRV